MEDKKVLEFINKNYEQSHKDFVKKEKKKRKKEIICNIIWFLACLTLVYVLVNVISQDTKKAVKNCVKLGNSYNYCLNESK